MLIKRAFLLLLLSTIAMGLFYKTHHFLKNVEIGVNYQNEYELNSVEPLKNSQKRKNPEKIKKPELSKKLGSHQMSPEQIYEEADYAVKIKIFEPVVVPLSRIEMLKYVGFGSGSNVKCEKYNFCVLTARHVVETPDATFYAEFKDGSPPQKLELISGTTTYDCAILKFSNPNFKPEKTATLGKSSDLKAGTEILAIGSSDFGDFWINTGSLHVKAGPADPDFKAILENIKANRPSFLFISANIFQGFSGGPLINKNNEVIGISTNIISMEPNQVVYVGSPIDEIKSALKIIK